MTISQQLHRHGTRPLSLAAIVAFIAAIMSATLVPLDMADARSGYSGGSKSSGGYSRSASRRSRTPSTASATDRAMSRRGAALALEQFETKRRTPSSFTRPAAQSSSHTSGVTTAHRHRSPVELDIDIKLPWFGNRYTHNGGGAVAAVASSTAAGFVQVVLALMIGAIVLALVAALLYYVLRQRAATVTAPSPTTSRPAWLRVGMTIPLDPAAFILAAPVSRIQPPPAATSSGLLSVLRVSQVISAADALVWQRLYLTEERHFLQIHLDAAGQPDECRYFALLDEITPSDMDEWHFWLDEHEGAIGWPDFQTQDGQQYQRWWATGDGRIAPQVLTETVTTATAAQPPRRLQAMLYGRATDAAPPAPATEYLLVCAVKESTAAWVALYLGIDYHCAALALS